MAEQLAQRLLAGAAAEGGSEYSLLGAAAAAERFLSDVRAQAARQLEREMRWG